MKTSAARRPPAPARQSRVRSDSQRGSQGGHAYQKLRGLVKDGVLKPGDRIVEASIASQLKVSRTPVRDAIVRLQAEGLLDYEPRSGLVVAKLDRRGVVELYEMREVLEGTAARLFTRHASDVEVEQLGEFVELERQLQGNARDLASHNLKFHAQIHRGAHNRFLEKALRAVNAVRWLLGPTQMVDTARAEQSLSEHTELVRAIQRRDAETAELIARKHLRSAHVQRMKTLFPVEDES
jgi:DNA-binding GntR family transcriptional regulator